MRVDERYVSVTGGRVYTRRESGGGAQTPVVVLHGGPGCPYDYLESLSTLAVDRPVIFYDQLGCGRSDRSDDASLWQLQRFISELCCVVDAWELQRFHIVAHSWGTMLAVDYALRYPEQIDQLVLLSPCLSMTRVRADLARLTGALPSNPLSLASAAGSDPKRAMELKFAEMEFYRRHIYRNVGATKSLQRSNDGWGWPTYTTMWGPAEYLPTGNLRDYEREPLLRHIRSSVLLLCGRHDEMTPEAVSAYAAGFSQAQMHVLEESAHLGHIEQPDAFFEHVRGFLRS